MTNFKIEDLYVGQKYLKKVTVDEKIGHAFADVSNDYNPIHLDDTYAHQTRFGKKICHGMLFGSYISGVIGNEFPGNGAVYMKQELKFCSPIYYDMEVTILVEVKQIFIEKNRVLLKTVCLNDDKTVLIDGEALIMLES